jgi:hypothetical protein
MNALVGLNLLKKDRKGKYSLTQESAAFLLSKNPGTHAGFFGTIAPQLISRATIARYRSRRSSRRRREPGNRRHGILQSAGGKYHDHLMTKPSPSPARDGPRPRVVGVIISQADLDSAIRMRERRDLFELRLDHLVPRLRSPRRPTARQASLTSWKKKSRDYAHRS